MINVPKYLLNVRYIPSKDTFSLFINKALHELSVTRYFWYLMQMTSPLALPRSPNLFPLSRLFLAVPWGPLLVPAYLDILLNQVLTHNIVLLPGSLTER
jgi:hypothetical protein